MAIDRRLCSVCSKSFNVAGSRLVPNQEEIGITRANCMNSMQLGVNGVNEFSVEWE